MKRLVVTGGHATPAIAVIEALRKKGDWQVDWIGERRAIAGTGTKTLEANVLPELGIPFHPITTPKIHRHNLLKTIFYLWKFPLGFIQSFYLLAKLGPNIVLTFGSYLSFPVALAAYLRGIPVVVHEQTAASGLANRVVSRFAKRIAISFQESSKYFPKGKTVLTGNPIRKAFFSVAEKRAKREINKRNPQLLIFGGSRGAVAINSVILESLHAILLKFDCLHVTGELDYRRVEKERDALPAKLRAKYKIYPTLNFSQVENALERSDLAISRAGANTVTEFAAVGLPAIFIPLPVTDSDEQTKNAQVLVKAGSSIILPQSELTKERLLATLDTMLKNLEEYRQRADTAHDLVVKDAPERIARLIEELV